MEFSYKNLYFTVIYLFERLEMLSNNPVTPHLMREPIYGYSAKMEGLVFATFRISPCDSGMTSLLIGASPIILLQKPRRVLAIGIEIFECLTRQIRLELGGG